MYFPAVASGLFFGLLSLFGVGGGARFEHRALTFHERVHMVDEDGIVVTAVHYRQRGQR